MRSLSWPPPSKTISSNLHLYEKLKNNCIITYSIILLYFIRLNNSYCAENLNIVLDRVITYLLFCLYLFYFLISKNVTNFHIHMDFVILYGSTEKK